MAVFYHANGKSRNLVSEKTLYMFLIWAVLSQGVTQVLKLKVWTQDFVGAVLVSYQQVNFQFCVLVVIGDEGSNNEQKKNRFVVALLYSFWKMQEKI